MARYIVSLHCRVFLFWQLILINFIKAEDEILKGMIKDGETEIHFNWKKTNHLLANENLPVWLAKIRPHSSHTFPHNYVIHELKKNFMKENIGDFTLYHDIEKLSAVVYFENTKTIHGMIDTRYMIYGMPIDECNQGHQVGGNYVKRNDKKMDIHDYLKPLNHPTHRNEQSGAFYGESSSVLDHKCGIPKKRQRLEDNNNKGHVTKLYPEILVFVPYDTMKYVIDFLPKKASVAILRHFIVYFNGIDMLFAKLSTDDIKIHLNLAGIVFENKNNVFNFITPVDVNGPPDAPGPRRYINIEPTFNRISNYINNNLDTFPEDSFDFFFVPFGMEFWSNGDICQGVSNTLDYYNIRKNIPPMHRYRAGLIVDHGRPCEYIISAHEIGHLMNIQHEAQTKGYQNGEQQCYAIMQETNPYCIDCLKWTEENVADLKKFIRESRNHCFLLNPPRSLHPHGNRMIMFSRLNQCLCYAFQHWPINELEDYIDEVPQNSCNQEMICGENSQAVNTILPVDGTPCATNKVCWNQVCQPI